MRVSVKKKPVSEAKGRHRRWLFSLFWIAAAVGVTLVLYLSWVPDSRMNDVPWMPHWLGAWADHDHQNSRTALPFVGLGLVTGFLLFLGKAHRLRRWLAAWGVLAVVALVAELGQIPIPTREFKFADIAWGALGAAIGLGLARLFSDLRHRFQKS